MSSRVVLQPRETEALEDALRDVIAIELLDDRGRAAAERVLGVLRESQTGRRPGRVVVQAAAPPARARAIVITEKGRDYLSRTDRLQVA